MRKLWDPEVFGRVREAIRSHDWTESMRLTTEKVESTAGEEKAFWLALRADLREMYCSGESLSAAEADRQESYRLDKDNPRMLFGLMHRAIVTQQMDGLRDLPKSVRRRIRAELFPNWRFWSNVGALHRVLRRWYPSYRAHSRALKEYLALSPEERKYDTGWVYHLRCWRARAALRVGRISEAVEDLNMAAETLRERPDISPMFLALAQAELAFCQGNYAAAQEALHTGTALLAQTPDQIKTAATTRIDCLILAARISRAKGNMVGFQHFCEQGLAIAAEAKLPYSEQEIRLILAGAAF